ncbi:MAG: cell envelope integrity protein CreD [Bacteroidales bacterium]|nr:cell envelope integrity protein CreD [Bacteroidales bacterium]
MTEKKQNFLERNAVVIKIAAIAFLILLLLIPMAMVRSLVMERRGRQIEATKEITSKWGNEQCVTGPILTIPFKTYNVDKETNKTVVSEHLAYFLPEKLRINGMLNPSVRRRGIFKVAVYSSTIEVEGYFKSPVTDFSDGADIDLKGAYITVGISDLRGIKESVSFNWEGIPLNCEPGSRIIQMIKSGVTVNGLFSKELGTQNIHFSFKMSLNGSENIKFVPVGRETDVLLKSSWNNPSFDGAFLPADREVSDSGFVAKWKVLELNRNYPQKWVDSQQVLDNSAFGVSLLLPVETYQITERSMKYAILFIALTFMVFFFVEVLRKLKVHPIQYGLVGLGLILFYLLLLSLSEQIGFGYAYLIASIAIVLMITGYSYSIFKNIRLTLLLGILLAALYLFLYILLQMQDYALLIGSIGLFVVLSVTMYLSRKIDWYSIGNGKSE